MMKFAKFLLESNLSSFIKAIQDDYTDIGNLMGLADYLEDFTDNKNIAQILQLAIQYFNEPKNSKYAEILSKEVHRLANQEISRIKEEGYEVSAYKIVKKYGYNSFTWKANNLVSISNNKDEIVKIEDIDDQNVIDWLIILFANQLIISKNYDLSSRDRMFVSNINTFMYYFNSLKMSIQSSENGTSEETSEETASIYNTLSDIWRNVSIRDTINKIRNYRSEYVNNLKKEINTVLMRMQTIDNDLTNEPGYRKLEDILTAME